MNLILLNGRNIDPHIKGITKELKKLKENYVILDNFSANDRFDVNFFKGRNTGKIKIQNNLIDISNIKSIWNTSPLQIRLDSNLADEAKNFVKAEWIEGVNSLWNGIDARWINQPTSIINAGNRLKQLHLASKTGLTTPKTTITNDVKILKNFFKNCDGEIVAKTLHSSEGLPESKMIFTTKITKENLEEANTLKYAPCMFQEYIPKTTEFRVTIVGNVIRSAEIYSQKSEKTKHDWRHYDDFKKTPYIQSDLPKKLSVSLLRLMKLMNLKFGAIDLIKTPDDKFVFLEVNPNGRWWWIQELTGMNIAKDIALYLSE